MFFSKHMDPKMVQQKQSKTNLTTELRLISDLQHDSLYELKGI